MVLSQFKSSLMLSTFIIFIGFGNDYNKFKIYFMFLMIHKNLIRVERFKLNETNKLRFRIQTIHLKLKCIYH